MAHFSWCLPIFITEGKGEVSHSFGKEDFQKLCFTRQWRWSYENCRILEIVWKTCHEKWNEIAFRGLVKKVSLNYWKGSDVLTHNLEQSHNKTQKYEVSWLFYSLLGVSTRYNRVFTRGWGSCRILAGVGGVLPNLNDMKNDKEFWPHWW